MSHIAIQRIPVENAREIVQFINSNFAKTEPLCEYLGTLTSEFNDVIVQKTVELGFSFEAIDTQSNGKRVGVFLVAPTKEGVASDVDLALEKMQIDSQMEKISGVMDYAKAQVFPVIQQKYPWASAEYMDAVIVNVLPEYAGHGIAARLLKAVEELSVTMGLPMVYVACSSLYSAKLVAKAGYEEMYSLRYEEYLGDNGQPVFQPRPPHDTLRVYIKLLRVQGESA